MCVYIPYVYMTISCHEKRSCYIHNVLSSTAVCIRITHLLYLTVLAL